jgi:hypothetical protein
MKECGACGAQLYVKPVSSELRCSDSATSVPSDFNCMSASSFSFLVHAFALFLRAQAQRQTVRLQK